MHASVDMHLIWHLIYAGNVATIVKPQHISMVLNYAVVCWPIICTVADAESASVGELVVPAVHM